MKIIDVKYNFVKNLVQRNTTEKIIIHHSASDDVSAQIIHKWHLNNGWSGIGYHFIIRQNGDIERGRFENTIGAHALNNNSSSIGICLTGNFMNTTPTENQIKALVWLIKYLKNKYGDLKILGHNSVAQTLCPGKNFPWDRLFTDLKKDDITLIINDKQVNVPIRTINGRIQIQISDSWIILRELADVLYGQLKWDNETKTAYLNFN
jgi:N-acetyl-anhydromuramyl-L-alanine amidase AmpD